MSLPALFYVNQCINDCINDCFPSALNTGSRIYHPLQSTCPWDETENCPCVQSSTSEWLGMCKEKEVCNSVKLLQGKRGRAWHAMVLGGSLHWPGRGTVLAISWTFLIPCFCKRVLAVQTRLEPGQSNILILWQVLWDWTTRDKYPRFLMHWEETIVMTCAAPRESHLAGAHMKEKACFP